jgi:integrase
MWKHTGCEFCEDMFVFSSTKTPDHSALYPPSAVTQRYKDMAPRVEVKAHLHALRHYSVTELLSTCVDIRTVAGRLGRGGGGATTLHVYAAWSLLPIGRQRRSVTHVCPSGAC